MVVISWWSWSGPPCCLLDVPNILLSDVTRLQQAAVGDCDMARTRLLDWDRKLDHFRETTNFETGLWQTFIRRSSLAGSHYHSRGDCNRYTSLADAQSRVVPILPSPVCSFTYLSVRADRLRYLPLVPILVILAVIPDYTLRLHHYLLALALFPVMSLSNRVSLFGQAFALGLLLDGVGRWGWDSILQYTASVRHPSHTCTC